MAFEIVQRTPSFGTDKRVVLDNIHPPLVRKMSIGNDWNEVRIGIHISTRRASAWSGFPGLYIGVCNGTDSPPGTTGCRHFFGVKHYGNFGWIPALNAFWGSGDRRVCMIQNGSETLHSSNQNTSMIITGDVANTGASNNPSVYALTIVKGTPWMSRSWVAAQNPDSVYASMEYFEDMMGAPLASPPSGISASSSQTSDVFTPDEGTYGDFDSICVVALNGTDPFEISNIKYSRFS